MTTDVKHLEDRLRVAEECFLELHATASRLVDQLEDYQPVVDAARRLIGGHPQPLPPHLNEPCIAVARLAVAKGD